MNDIPQYKVECKLSSGSMIEFAVSGTQNLDSIKIAAYSRTTAWIETGNVFHVVNFAQVVLTRITEVE